jgi:exosome complex exonuclease RRP6
MARFQIANPSFDEFITKSQRMALGITMETLSMPSDITFHRSMDYSLAQTSDTFSVRVMSLMNGLLGLASTIDSTNLKKYKGKMKLDNQDDLLDKFHAVVVDSMDHLLERAVCSSLKSLNSVNLSYLRTFAWMNILERRNPQP